MPLYFCQAVFPIFTARFGRCFVGICLKQAVYSRFAHKLFYARFFGCQRFWQHSGGGSILPDYGSICPIPLPQITLISICFVILI